MVEYLPKRKTMNSQYIWNLLSEDLRHHLQKQKRGKPCSKPILQMDDVTLHTASLTKELLAKLSWEIFPHLPYSPDIVSLDFQLFLRLREPWEKGDFRCLKKWKKPSSRGGKIQKRYFTKIDCFLSWSPGRSVLQTAVTFLRSSLMIMNDCDFNLFANNVLFELQSFHSLCPDTFLTTLGIQIFSPPALTSNADTPVLPQSCC